MLYKGPAGERLWTAAITSSNAAFIKEFEANDLTIVWFVSGDNVLEIDGVLHVLEKNQLVCLTEFHKIDIKAISNARVIRFSRSFYCILDHDVEVSCKGILFFGASQLPVITIPLKELGIFETVYNMFLIELRTRDNLQLEMLQMMLKRFLILCARLHKLQMNFQDIQIEQVNVIREFNFLVEQHFRDKHTVAEYAALLHKSPKTLANLFTKLSDKTPLQYIQERKMLEARRLLRYGRKSIKEVANEIGFEDIQTFSRFFKKNEGIPASEYRKMR